MIDEQRLHKDIIFQVERVANYCIDVAYEYVRPSTVYKPKIFRDGDKWCALYGDNLQDGVSGFGDSPAKAFYDFDNNFSKPRGGA